MARREQFGQTSERGKRLIDQLELQLAEIEEAAAEDEAAAQAATGTVVAAHVRQKPARRPLPAHLPRERLVVPAPTTCQCCGGRRLAKIGEVITETLDVVPRRWFVRQTVREKFTCRDCEQLSEPPAPFHVIPRARIGASLLAMILFEKYGQHQPLNRQSERYAREGVDLDVSTLADHVGAGVAALAPLHELIRRHVLAAERLHGDDTTVRGPQPGGARSGVACRCSPRARPSPVACGPMSVTTGRSAKVRRRSSSTTPAIAAGSTPSSIWPTMPGSCRPMPTVDSAGSMRRRAPADRLPRRSVGHTLGEASSSSPTSRELARGRHPRWRWRRSVGSTRSSSTSARSTAVLPLTGSPTVRRTWHPWSRSSRPG